MNTKIRYILCVLGGFAVGALTSGLIVRKFYEDELERQEALHKARATTKRKEGEPLVWRHEHEDPNKIMNDYVDSLKKCGYAPYEPTPEERQAEWAARQKALREAAETMWAEEEYPGEEEGAEKLTPNGDISDEAYRYDPKEDYRDDPVTSGEVDEEEEIAKAAAKPSASEPPKRPYVITERNFLEDYPDDDWAKESIEYFAFDDIIADTDDSIFDMNIIGRGNLREFELTDCPSIYIRNETLRIDYEILWNDASYHEVVLGENRHEMKKWLRRPYEGE